MTVRRTSDALGTFAPILDGIGLRPIEARRTRNGVVSGVLLRDPLFASAWWGHAAGSAIGRDPLGGAYGEVVENVSCDLWYPDWLSCRRTLAPSGDEEVVDREVCAASLPAGTGVRRAVELGPAAVHRVHPYVRLDDPTQRLRFPRDLGLEVAGRNNGGAVGSDREEALVTGLYEVFERFVLGKLALGTERFPLLDPAVFEGTRIAAILRDRQVLYVDLTLGGRLPVLGVILVDAEPDRMTLAVAGSHDPLDAVEHCVREMLSDDYYGDPLVGWPAEPDRTARIRQWARSGFTRGWGGSLAQIDFASGWSTVWREAFDPGAADNGPLLQKAVASAGRFGCGVWARDCSILGVPAFHVYAGALSENLFVAHEGLLDPDDNARLVAAISRDRWLSDHLPVLDRAVAGDPSGWTRLRALLANPFVGYPDDEDVCDVFGWPVAAGHGFRGVSLSALIAGLAYHDGHPHEAAALWPRARPVVGHFLDLVARVGDRNLARPVFAAAFGDARLAEVERELSVSALIRLPLNPGDTELEVGWQRFRDRVYGS